MVQDTHGFGETLIVGDIGKTGRGVRLDMAILATKSTQPCIPPGPLNRVPASAAGVKAGMSPLPGGR